jgi:hypothetical protein
MLPRTELFLYDTDEQEEYEVIQHAYPDSMQLGGILGTPDKPELHVLAKALGDAEEVSAAKGGVGRTEHLPGLKRLHEHEEDGPDSRYVAVAQAQINEGVRSAGGVDVAVGHVINEDKGAGDTWAGEVGYVHQALCQRNMRIPRNTGAVVCGQPDMQRLVRTYLEESGVCSGRIPTIF